eukprot:350044-Chlamydomonas_euryale.AAC.4
MRGQSKACEPGGGANKAREPCESQVKHTSHAGAKQGMQAMQGQVSHASHAVARHGYAGLQACHVLGGKHQSTRIHVRLSTRVHTPHPRTHSQPPASAEKQASARAHICC